VLWEALTQHHRDLYQDPSLGGDNPGFYFDRHLARVGSDHIWVAVYDGKVIGLVGLILGEQEAEVEPLIVTPQFRSRGVGRALLDQVIGEVKRLKVRYLNVRPVARNIEAVSFFYNSGFRILGQIELCMDLKSNDYITWKLGPDLYGYPFMA
jgi:N-acetylglutamate synthase-like GNAT family acetyltransferase